MLEPLKQFICDTCKQVIEKPEDGWFEWIERFNDHSRKLEAHSYRIVHHVTSAPDNQGTYRSCQFSPSTLGIADGDLTQFLPQYQYGMANLLSFLDIGETHNKHYRGPKVVDMREYVETVRRLTIPYYEEARQYWNEAVADGYFTDANNIGMYGAENLKNLILQYGEE